MGRAPKQPKAQPTPPPRDNRRDRLLRFIERIEEMEEQKRSIAADLGYIRKEAKLAGFDLKTIAQMIRERAMEPEDRRVYQALCETYRATLGMLDGTPLGDAARRRLLPDPPPEADAGRADTPEHLPDATAGDARRGALPPSADDVKAARAEGEAAAQAGRQVTENPYPALDPRRSAWDEGWCAAAGSDGMDVPVAWRRPSKKKPGDAKGLPA